MMRCLTEREQERVWELRAEGHSSRAIGRELGLRPQYVSLCVALTGGVRPPVRKRSRRWLTKTEREEISRGLARGDGFRAIAVRISRSHTWAHSPRSASMPSQLNSTVDHDRRSTGCRRPSDSRSS
jgi:hypothetical protein